MPQTIKFYPDHATKHNPNFFEELGPEGSRLRARLLSACKLQSEHLSSWFVLKSQKAKPEGSSCLYSVRAKRASKVIFFRKKDLKKRRSKWQNIYPWQFEAAILQMLYKSSPSYKCYKCTNVLLDTDKGSRDLSLLTMCF